LFNASDARPTAISGRFHGNKRIPDAADVLVAIMRNRPG
jgi:hypothetical protein